MNINEEKMTHWWSEFLVRERHYDILIRNLFVGNNEYDGVGIWFDGNKYTLNPRVENIEAKFAKERNVLGAGKKLKKQLENRHVFGGFHSLLALSNATEVLTVQPEYAGRVLVSNPDDKHLPSGRIIQDSVELVLKFDGMEKIRNAVTQVYKAARQIEAPCIFVRCRNIECRSYYGFPAYVPLPPIAYDANGHSPYCPASHAFKTSPRYAYINQGFTIANVRYCVTRLNSLES